jgi:hypothetical protein
VWYMVCDDMVGRAGREKGERVGGLRVCWILWFGVECMNAVVLLCY